jgi:mannose-6-phosphate isomerase class I
VLTGHEAIARAILERLRGLSRAVVVCDGFVGVRWDIWRECLDAALAGLGRSASWVNVQEALAEADAARNAVIQSHLTDDPLFGRLYRGKITDFFDRAELRRLKERVARNPGITVVYGAGASLVGGAGDCLLYLDVSKEEFQNRCRQKMVANFACRQPASFGEMYKRAYYIDYPVLNLEKRRLLPHLDFVVDEIEPYSPRAAKGEPFRAALAEVARAPVRVMPYFMPGPWGGQWMKQNFGLPPGPPNYAWSYELIAPENGLRLGSEQEWLEVSLDYLLWQEADTVMGRPVTSIFGSSFPIRFDYLDTMQGGNLSCQVHPRPDYIRDEFGEPYTQHETYYVMQAGPGARVYFGLQEDIDPAKFRAAAERAKNEAIPFDINEFVHSLPSQPHDLFLIPAGTVHCSGADNLVLEISSTPYMYTFKIYDYLRQDLDGTLRHVSIEHAFANIEFSRKGRWVAEHLKPAPRLLRGDSEAAEYVLEDLDLFFHAIHRLEFTREISDAVRNRFLVLNLVEGECVEIETARGKTELHYAETIIVPAGMGEYRLINRGSRACKVVKAFVK